MQYFMFVLALKFLLKPYMRSLRRRRHGLRMRDRFVRAAWRILVS